MGQAMMGSVTYKTPNVIPMRGSALKAAGWHSEDENKRCGPMGREAQPAYPPDVKREPVSLPDKWTVLELNMLGLAQHTLLEELSSFLLRRQDDMEGGRSAYL
jgi:hypothetical protein